MGCERVKIFYFFGIILRINIHKGKLR